MMPVWFGGLPNRHVTTTRMTFLTTTAKMSPTGEQKNVIVSISASYLS